MPQLLSLSLSLFILVTNLFLIGPFPASFWFSFVLSKHLTVSIFKIYRLLDLNHEPPLSEATALPTELQPLPTVLICLSFFYVYKSVYLGSSVFLSYHCCHARLFWLHLVSSTELCKAHSGHTNRYL